MKNKLIKLSILFLLLIGLIIVIPNFANANSVTDVKKYIKVDKNGNAKVVEVWKANMNSGTEIYMPYDNLEDSEFKNLKVSDDRGITYETLSSWSVNASFDNKKNKCAGG